MPNWSMMMPKTILSKSTITAMDEGGEAMQTAVATLLRFGGGWVDIGGFEITAMGGAAVVNGNPMYVVQAVKRYCPLVS